MTPQRLPEPSQCTSIIVPCFNEASTIKELLTRVLESPYVGEVILVDDGSSDDTVSIARSVEDPRLNLLTHTENRGKGAAIRTGISEARFDFVLIQDADLEYDPGDYPQLLEPLLLGKADVVYGSRFMTDRPHRVLYFWHSVGNRALTLLSNAFTNLNLTDMETGYKAFRREVIQGLELRENGFGIEPEITAKIAHGPWRIFEVGISYWGRTYLEGKKVGWRDGVRTVWCIVKYSKGRSLLRSKTWS